MLGVRTKTTTDTKPVEAATKDATFRNLAHAAASARKTIRAMIERAPQDEPSEPGEPPHTHRGLYLRRAVFFFVDKEADEALVGFVFSRVGDVGAVHEYGEFRREDNRVVSYPERPTIGPALEAVAPRMGDTWEGSIGN